MCDPVRLGVNLGVNKSNALDWKAAARDYTLGVQKLAKYADYIVINVSSPNTMGASPSSSSLLPSPKRSDRSASSSEQEAILAALESSQTVCFAEDGGSVIR